MVDDFRLSENYTTNIHYGKNIVALSGSENMACYDSLYVNVRDPIFSLARVLADKCKSEEAKMECRKSDES